MSKKIIVLAVVSMLLVATLAGCGSSPAPNKDPEGNEAIKITFVQDFPQPAWVAQMPWTVADSKGWYEEKNMDVDFVWPATPSDPIKYIATGKADITATYTSDVLTAVSEGMDVLIVASIMDKDCGGIIAYEDSGIKSPKDFKGKTVAIYDIPLTQLHFSTMMKHHGLTRDDFTQVSAGDYSLPLLLTNKVDAADGAGPAEMVMLEQESGKKVNIWYYDEEHGVPQRYWLVMAVNPKFAEENPQAVKDFIEATFKGLNYSKENPEESTDMFASKYTDLDKTAIVTGFESLVGRSYERFNPEKPQGWQDIEIWENYQDFLYENELLREKVDINKIVTNEYLPQ